MEKMKDLRDLLTHEIQDLYSAEEQIIAALPAMIEKAGNPQLREALERHLRITEEQKERLEQVKQLMAEGVQEEGEAGEQKRSFLANLFSSRKEEKCLGMEGLIREGEKALGEPMEPAVLDAAIVACAQKIEHYEICGYGTARAFARELDLGSVAELLEETLDEEYEANDRLTDLAVGRLNEEAESGASTRRLRSGGANSGGRSGASAASKGASKGAGRGRAGSKGASKTATKSASKGASKGARGASKTATKRRGGNTGGATAGRKSAPGKAAAKKGGRNSGGGRGGRGR